MNFPKRERKNLKNSVKASVKWRFPVSDLSLHEGKTGSQQNQFIGSKSVINNPLKLNGDVFISLGQEGEFINDNNFVCNAGLRQVLKNFPERVEILQNECIWNNLAQDLFKIFQAYRIIEAGALIIYTSIAFPKGMEEIHH